MTLQALLERVEAASGPVEEIDNLIWWHFFCPERGKDDAMRVGPMDNVAKRAAWARCFYGKERSTKFTASLDAAVGLVEKMLPGQACALGTMAFRNETRKPWATIWTTSGSPLFNADAATPALALIAALLKALISQSNPERPGVE